MNAGSQPKLAVLGLGLLGAEVAVRLAAKGFATTGWNRTAEKALAVGSRGVAVVETAAAAVAGADIVLLLLSDAAAIENTLWDGSPRPDLAGKCLVQMGAIGPDESRRIARRVARAGGDYLEAPVLGSLPEARAGSLILMAGGDPALFERCVPVFSALSNAPRRIGEVGQAAALKLAMNQLIAGLTATFSLSLGLVRAEGIDVEQFMTLLRGSALYAATFDKKLGKYMSHDYSAANFPLKHLLKDISLFRRIAESTRIDSASLSALETACERGLNAGLGEADYSALYEVLTEGIGKG